MTRQKTTKGEKFVVDRVGEGKGTLHIFRNLQDALEYYYSPNFQQIDGGKRFIAKAIDYFMTADSNGQIQVNSSKDFSSKEPYYLLNEHTGIYDTYGGEISGIMCEVSSYKDLITLVKKGIPDARGTRVIVAHGLELKLG